MNRDSEEMKDFARYLIACEAGGTRPSATKNPDGFSVTEKLRLHLATFLGKTGCHTILTRVLALSAAEVPWLRAVRLNADGSLKGEDEPQTQLSADEVSEGKLVLLAEFLGLLVAFIGKDLTVRLVREVWPKVSLNGLDLSRKGTYEKAK